MNLFKTKLSIIAVAMLLLSNCFTLHAKQLSYKKKAVGSEYQFRLSWLDVLQKEQQLNFSLPSKQLFSSYRSFKAYQPQHAVNFVQKQLVKKLRNKPFPQVSIKFAGNSTSVNLSGSSPEAIANAQQQIAQWENSALLTYLEKNFYHQFVTVDGSVAIKPNHVRIARESAEIFKPLKQTIIDSVAAKKIRDVSDYVINMIQAIPYSTLESRQTSSGAGFNVPTKVIWENQGDCDSKMTLAGAMLRAVMPRLNMVFVYLDNHALMGIAVSPQAGDITIQDENGVVYVLADPTGPVQMNIGQLTFDVQQAINAGHYTLEAFK